MKRIEKRIDKRLKERDLKDEPVVVEVDGNMTREMEWEEVEDPREKVEAFEEEE